MEELYRQIDAMEGEMAKALCRLVEIPAISPASGGEGERAKAQAIAEIACEMGLPSPERYDAPSPGGDRPNLVVTLEGTKRERLWIVTHMDVVPEGDRSLWDTDPFKGLIKDGKVFGRGANDNGQELVASLYALYALKRSGVTPARDICLAFVADEEMGSAYGIQHLISLGLFRPDDLVVVPDVGNERGDFIEVAEKAILWLEFCVLGKQAHASRPEDGLNACRAANQLSVALDEAYRRAFPEEDRLFSPPVSTFEPTRRRANVSNVNTIPGREIFAFDCRILPSAGNEAVLKVTDQVCRDVSNQSGAKISYDILQRTDAAPVTPVDAPVVKLLEAAVGDVLHIKPVIGGVGGGTCAAFFRRTGIPAAVWAQEANVAHEPNEYAVIEHMVNEAKVFAHMMAS